MSQESVSSGWPRVGVMGGGAIGCLYGGWLARAGAPVTIVTRPRHVHAIHANGLRVTGRDFDFQAAVYATTEMRALSDCELILFCTKTRDTETVARELTAFLSLDATVLAFQNGVDGAERLAAILQNPVFPAALFVSCQIEGPGHVRHNGRGDVRLGEWFTDRDDVAERRTRLEAIAQVLQRAGIATDIADDIRKTLWTKLAMNCAYNAISALGRARYDRVVGTDSSSILMRRVVEELVTVGRADGVDLNLDVVLKAVMDLGGTMPRAISSTGQDIAAGRHTEVDDLNGFVAHRGHARGIATPVNETLQLLVRVLEDAPVDPAFFPKSAG